MRENEHPCLIIETRSGLDLIKACTTGGVLSKGTKLDAVQYTLEEMEALVDEAHAHGRRVAIHAHGTAGIRNAILAGADSVETDLTQIVDDALDQFLAGFLTRSGFVFRRRESFNVLA